jgi:hypothetical protein
MFLHATTRSLKELFSFAEITVCYHNLAAMAGAKFEFSTAADGRLVLLIEVSVATCCKALVGVLASTALSGQVVGWREVAALLIVFGMATTTFMVYVKRKGRTVLDQGVQTVSRAATHSQDVQTVLAAAPHRPSGVGFIVPDPIRMARSWKKYHSVGAGCARSAYAFSNPCEKCFPMKTRQFPPESPRKNGVQPEAAGVVGRPW